MAPKTETPPITDDEVAEALAAQREADALVLSLEREAEDLEKAVTLGDESVTADALEEKAKLGRFARLRAQHTESKAVQALEAQRLRDCRTLHDEIQAHAHDAGQHLADLLQTAGDAISAFTAAASKRNEKIVQWRNQAEALSIPEHRVSYAAPPAEHGHLGLGNVRAVVAGDRIVDEVNADSYVANLIDLLQRTNKLGRLPEYAQGSPEMFTTLAAIDQPTPIPEGLHFYRSVTGAITYRAVPYSVEETGRMELTEISQTEATER